MPKKILIVDDEELLTKSFSKILERQGYEVYTVRSGADAVVMVEEEKFDLIISDIRMPGETGVETIKKIRENSKFPIPVIFITGYADEKIEKEAKTLEPTAYLFKPFDTKQFLDLVKTTLGS